MYTCVIVIIQYCLMNCECQIHSLTEDSLCTYWLVLCMAKLKKFPNTITARTVMSWSDSMVTLIISFFFQTGDISIEWKRHRERERERERERDRQTDRQTDRKRQRDRGREKDRETGTQRSRDKQTHRRIKI